MSKMAAASSLLSRCLLALRPLTFQPMAAISSSCMMQARTAFSAKSATAKAPATTKKASTASKKASPAKSAKGKASADKDGPKRAPTAYNFFVKEMSPQRPKDMKHTEYVSAMSKDFKALTAAQKEKYEKLAEPGRIAYEAAKKILEAAKRHRPPSAYNLFVKDRFVDRPKNTKARDYIKVLGQNFRQLDDGEKDKYVEAARILKAQYLGSQEEKVPTRPPSAYNLYIQENMANRGEGESPQDVMRHFGLLWKNLDASLKKKYEVLAAEKKEEFKSAAKSAA